MLILTRRVGETLMVGNDGDLQSIANPAQRIR
jgi:sRNA-binding carbon storage regulator CsrA